MRLKKGRLKRLKHGVSDDVGLLSRLCVGLPTEMNIDSVLYYIRFDLEKALRRIITSPTSSSVTNGRFTHATWCWHLGRISITSCLDRLSVAE